MNPQARIINALLDVVCERNCALRRISPTDEVAYAAAAQRLADARREYDTELQRRFGGTVTAFPGLKHGQFPHTP